MLALADAQLKSAVVTLLVAISLLGIALSKAPEADAIGLGPAGWYSFGSSDCNEGSRSDPIGALFRGKRASAHNVADQVKHHAEWWNDVAKDQYLWVLLSGGAYGCQEADESVAESSDIGPYSRYHTRLWFVPATNGSTELKTVGTPHHEDWITYNPLNNHCQGVTGVGSHAVDQNGSNGSGFDKGRVRLKEAFLDAGHKVEGEVWGNTKEFEQCDGDWASSNGGGLLIWVNHAITAQTKGGTVTESTATLKGTVSTQEAATEWWFGYGTSPSKGAGGYPYKTSVTSTSATGDLDVSKAISGLTANTKYYVRVFARTPEGEVEEGAEIPYTTLPWYSDNLGGYVLDDPDVSSWGSGRLDVFALGADGKLLYHKWYSGGAWSGWEARSTGYASGFGATSWGYNRIDVVGKRASDGTVAHEYWTGSSWQKDNLGGYTMSDPDISSWGPERLDVVTVGADGKTLYHKWFTGAEGWSGWEGRTCCYASSPSIVSWGYNRIDIVGRRSSDNTVAHEYWTGSSWQKDNLGGNIVGSPEISSWAPGRLDVFARASDGKTLLHKWFTEGEGWSDWETRGGNYTSDPGAVSWGYNRIDVVGRASDGSVRHEFWAP